MAPKTRRLVFWISAPVIAFAIIGGFLSKVTAREGPYQNLKIFDDVVSLISNNYVEKVDIDKVMHGALDGLADSLDPDSAYLSSDQVKQVEAGVALPAGDVALAFVLATVVIKGSKTGERGSLLAVDAPELRHPNNESERSPLADTGNAEDEI